MRLVYRYMVILCLFFIVPDTLRADGEDVLERIDGDDIQHWHIPGTIYEHCLAEHILGEYSLFERDPQEVSRTTQRRLEEVELLLTLQQQLRGPH